MPGHVSLKPPRRTSSVTVWRGACSKPGRSSLKSNACSVIADSRRRGSISPPVKRMCGRQWNAPVCKVRVAPVVEEEGEIGGSGEGRRKECGGEPPRAAAVQGARWRMDLRRIRTLLLADAEGYASGEKLPGRGPPGRLRGRVAPYACVGMSLSCEPAAPPAHLSGC